MPLAGAGIIAANTSAFAQNSVTAGQLIARIREKTGVQWRENTVDTFKTGSPETTVTGIATSFMSTFDVLKRATAKKMNLILTHEPTFWNHRDETEQFKDDPIFQAKQDFIRKNNLVVFRFHDHWHMMKPDGIQTGIIEDLGWEKYRDGESLRNFSVPQTTLSSLARELRTKTNSRSTRVIGDPQLAVRKVTIMAGSTTLQPSIRSLRNSDVLVIGEANEWESVSYIQDAIAAGEKKALIILGHAPSEDPGMTYCAKWLKTFISEVPIEAVPAGDPFWVSPA